MSQANIKPQWITAKSAQRVLGASRRDVEMLCRAGVIEQRGKRKLSLASVENLLDRSRGNVYLTGLYNLDWNLPVALCVPLTDPSLSPHLELSPGNDLELATEGLRSREAPLGSDEFITGWWSVSDQMLRELVRSEAPILGVTGGFVTDVAFIRGVAITHPISRRRALVVRRPLGVERGHLYGRVSTMNQTGTYTNLRACDPSNPDLGNFHVGEGGKVTLGRPGHLS